MFAPHNAKLISVSSVDFTHFDEGEFRFCPHCSAEMGERSVGARLRRVCHQCGFVHFRDPAVGVAGVVFEDGQLLLVRRGPSATRSGLWCIPCGFLDYGEDVRAGAAREVLEETGLNVAVGDPVWVASNSHDPAKKTVGIWFDATVVGGELAAGDDADDVGFFPISALPDLAFETDAALIAALFGG